MTPPSIGFIGLGHMGTALAMNLAHDGYPMTVYNRTRERAKPLADAGASVADSPADVAMASDVVITSLADDAAVEQVITGAHGVVHGAHEGLIVIDTSTISPLTSCRIASIVRGAGGSMLDAPISGSVKPVQERTIAFFVGGERAVFEQCREILERLSAHVYYMGENGKGLYMKLATNLMLGANLEVLCEALALGEKAGLQRAQIFEALEGTGLYNSFIEGRRQSILDEDYTPSFPLRLMYKDYGVILSTAQHLRIPLPVAAVATQLYGAAANATPEADMAAIVKFIQGLAAAKPA